jgi:protein-S-isoprenylcysteine O-methyltransferase
MEATAARYMVDAQIAEEASDFVACRIRPVRRVHASGIGAAARPRSAVGYGWKGGPRDDSNARRSVWGRALEYASVRHVASATTHRHVVGPSVMVLSIALRSWAAITLGRYYTRTLRTVPDQPVIRSGPYRFVRHPGYLGTQLLWVGFGLSIRNWLAGSVWGAAMLLLYSRRVSAEESSCSRSSGLRMRSTCRACHRFCHA